MALYKRTGGNDCGKIQPSIAMSLKKRYSSAMARVVAVDTVAFLGIFWIYLQMIKMQESSVNIGLIAFLMPG